MHSLAFCLLFCLAFTHFPAAHSAPGSLATTAPRPPLDTLRGQQQPKKSYPVSPGQLLDIRLLTGGSLSVSGWNKNEVSVEADLAGADWGDTRLEFQPTPAGLEVRARYVGRLSSGKTTHAFRVRVPHRFSVQLLTEAGDVSLTGLEGTFTGTTRKGNLRLSELEGTAQLSTAGGEVAVSNCHLGGTVSTLLGKAHLQEVSGPLEALAPAGGVQRLAGKVAPTNQAGKEVKIAAPSGDIRVETAPLGAQVSTLRGNVEIASAGGPVRATSGGGNITLAAVAGDVEATAQRGDLRVGLVGASTQTGRRVRLTATGGDVTLTVPAGLSVEVTVEMFRTKGNATVYALSQDWGLKAALVLVSARPEAALQPYRWLAQSLLGGKNRIEIHVTDGNVYLKKSQ